MGKPAARIGDTCAHGGAITVGCPTVLIGNMLAARIGDMHVCPMQTPGVPPIPHVGGPITLGSPTVLIGGSPAARMGDMATCTGPPDTIAMGCPTVLIGEGGAGAGSGGGAVVGAVSASAAAHAGAAAALFDNEESSTKKEHWIEFQFVDKAGNSISGVPYRLIDADKKESTGVLRLGGTVRRDALKKGDCQVQLFSVFDAKWSRDEIKVGEKVKLSAKTEGFEDGIGAKFQIYKQDIRGADCVIAAIDTKIRSDGAEAEWTNDTSSDDEEIKNGQKRNYSNPQFYFELIVENCTARSGPLNIRQDIEIKLENGADKSGAGAEYILTLCDGTIRKGRLDNKGFKKEKNAPLGPWRVTFPGVDNTSPAAQRGN